MLIFGNNKNRRGAYAEVTKLRSRSAYVKVAGATFPSSPSSGMFVSQLTIGQKENIQVNQCFNDANYVYAFGHDPKSSTATVTFTVFMGSCSGTSDSSGLDKLLGAYNKGRVSVHKQFAYVTVGRSTFSGFLVDCRVGTVNTELNTMSATLTILLVKPQGQ